MRYIYIYITQDILGNIYIAQDVAYIFQDVANGNLEGPKLAKQRCTTQYSYICSLSKLHSEALNALKSSSIANAGVVPLLC